jgi:hypothetical protein
LHEYYIYDPGVKEDLGGMRVVINKDGERVVLLTDSQAGYWVASGVIGRIPLSKVSVNKRTQIHQSTGGRVPLKAEDKPAPMRPTSVQGLKQTILGPVKLSGRTPVRRTAVQNPNTMARKLTEGFHPVLGTTVTSNIERQRAPQKGKVRQTGFAVGLNKGE